MAYYLESNTMPPFYRCTDKKSQIVKLINCLIVNSPNSTHLISGVLMAEALTAVTLYPRDEAIASNLGRAPVVGAKFAICKCIVGEISRPIFSQKEM